MKINVPNHTSLEALHARELGSQQARKKRILQRDGEDCVGNPENKRVFWLSRKGGFQSWEERQGSQESGHLVQPGDFLRGQEHVTWDLWASLLHLGVITSVSMAVVILGTKQCCLSMCLWLCVFSMPRTVPGMWRHSVNDVQIDEYCRVV